MAYFNYHDEHLWAEEIPISNIVKTIGTPCYLYSHAALVDHWQAFDQAMGSRPHKICYSVKANSNIAVLNTLASLGSGFDIVSGGELARVIAAGGDPRQVVFSGVGKQPEEMISALKENIFCFNVESNTELATLNRLAAHFNMQAPIALRVNPDVDPGSHPYISTGLKESKFGIPFAEAFASYQLAQKMPHLKIIGIACHIGSQLTSMAPFVDAFNKVLNLIADLKGTGIAIHHMDVGGGLGVCYQEETPPSPQMYVKTLLGLCHDQDLMLVLEPGRAIAANAGLLITKVLDLKKSGSKRFCIVDCAMNDLIRPTLYTAWQNIIPIERRKDVAEDLYDIAGPICESGDFLGKDRTLAVLPQDYLAICSAGAYGFVMSSNYNTRPKPAEVMVKGNEFKVVRPRETLAQLLGEERIW